MKRGESVWVAIWMISTPNATTKPVRPTIAPTIALRTVLAVDSVYRHCEGSVTSLSSASVISASNGPTIAHISGTNHRLPFSRCRRRKRAAHDRRGAPTRAAWWGIGEGSQTHRSQHHPFRAMSPGSRPTRVT